MKKTYKILDTDYAAFERLLKSFNRILAANGKPALVPVAEKAEFEVVVHRHVADPDSGYDKEETFTCAQPGKLVTVDIPESTLAFDGCAYLGSMRLVDGMWQKHLADAANPANALVCPENFRCDHCHTARERRGYFFFLKEGALVVTGSKCANEYFGYDVAAVLEQLERLERFVEANFGGGCGERSSIMFGWERIIRWVAFATANFSKWTKKDADGELGTSAAVRHWMYEEMFRWDFEYPRGFGACAGLVPADAAARVAAYWAAKPEGNGDFAYNCKQAAASGYIGAGWLGYAIWAAYEALRPAKERLAAGEFQGAAGDRLEIQATVDNIAFFADEAECGAGGFYGYGRESDGYYRVELHDAAGNAYTLNTTGKVVTALKAARDAATPLALRGTVKRHFERRNGQRVTVLTRVTAK